MYVSYFTVQSYFIHLLLVPWWVIFRFESKIFISAWPLGLRPFVWSITLIPSSSSFTPVSFFVSSLLHVCKPRQHIKKQRHYFANKGPSSQSYGFSRSHVWMWELDHKESWVPKNWCFWTVVLEKTWESKEIKPVLKEISPENSLQGLMLKLKLQYFGHLMWRTDSFGKDPDPGKDWRQEEEGTTEDEMTGWHRRLDGR